MEKVKILRYLDKIMEYCLYGLAFTIPISISFIEIFATTAIVAFIAKKIMLRENILPERFRNITHISLLLFLVFSGLSMFNSGEYLGISLSALILKWVEYIFVFLIAEEVLNDERKFRNVLAFFLASAFLTGLEGIVQNITGRGFIRGKSMVRVKGTVYGIAGPFNHYNDFASYLVGVLPLAFVMIFSGKAIKENVAAWKDRYGVFFYLLTGILGFCLFSTFSRGSWVGLLASGALMILLSPKRKYIAAAMAGFLVLLLLIPVVRDRAMYTFQDGGDASRFEIWSGTLDMVGDAPFLGQGVGTYMSRFPEYIEDKGIQYAHNSYLQMWAEIGTFGLISFLVFMGSIMLRGVRLFVRRPPGVLSAGKEGLNYFVLLGLLCGLFGFLTHSFFDTQFYSLQQSVLMWFLFGLMSALMDLIEKKA